MPSHGFLLSGIRILILDDNPHMLDVLASLLGGLGCTELTMCETVDSALERVTAFQPDLVITDFQLDGETGVDFLNALRSRQDELTASLPVIAVTSHTEANAANALTGAGADEVLAKPITADALYRCIAHVAAERRQFVKTRTYFGPDRRRPKAADKDVTLVQKRRRADC